jgi:hypothetical protein
MSTQRRASRWQRRSCTERAGTFRTTGDRSWSRGWTVTRQIRLAPGARHDRADANDRTAPPAKQVRYRSDNVHQSSGAPEWLATNSLQSDYRTKQLVRSVRIVHKDIRPSSSSSPPPGAGRRTNFGTPATQRSSFPHIPFPSGFARLLPTLPQFPAGSSRRAERYDGKGNLYFKHAA